MKTYNFDELATIAIWFMNDLMPVKMTPRLAGSSLLADNKYDCKMQDAASRYLADKPLGPIPDEMKIEMAFRLLHAANALIEYRKADPAKSFNVQQAGKLLGYLITEDWRKNANVQLIRTCALAHIVDWEEY